MQDDIMGGKKKEEGKVNAERPTGRSASALYGASRRRALIWKDRRFRKKPVKAEELLVNDVRDLGRHVGKPMNAPRKGESVRKTGKRQGHDRSKGECLERSTPIGERGRRQGEVT